MRFRSLLAQLSPQLQQIAERYFEQLYRDRFVNEPDDIIESNYLNVGYNLEHRFNQNWKIVIRNNDAFTPRFGLVYQPIPTVSLYGEYSRSFTPNSETTVSGQPLEPERGEGWEVGAKTELELSLSWLEHLFGYSLGEERECSGQTCNPTGVLRIKA